MGKPFGLLCIGLLLLPHAAAAGTIVTWQAAGELRSSTYGGVSDTGLVTPAGTPYELTMTLDPSSMTPTVLSPPGSNCFTVSVSSSLTLGAYTYSGGGSGFTHAQRPVTNGIPSWDETQFLLAFPDAPAAAEARRMRRITLSKLP